MQQQQWREIGSTRKSVTPPPQSLQLDCLITIPFRSAAIRHLDIRRELAAKCENNFPKIFPSRLAKQSFPETWCARVARTLPHLGSSPSYQNSRIQKKIPVTKLGSSLNMRV